MAPANTVDRARPGLPVSLWTHGSLAILALGAWSAFLAYVGGTGSSAADTTALLSIPIYVFAHWRLFHAVTHDSQLTADEKAKIRGNLLWFGPAAVLHLLVRIHLPSSGLGG